MTAGRIKQLLHYWTAGELCGDERAAWLAADERGLASRLEEAADSRLGATAAP
jgi:hypothetical protein